MKQKDGVEQKKRGRTEGVGAGGRGAGGGKTGKMGVRIVPLVEKKKTKDLVR